MTELFLMLKELLHVLLKLVPLRCLLVLALTRNMMVFYDDLLLWCLGSLNCGINLETKAGTIESVLVILVG